MNLRILIAACLIMLPLSAQADNLTACKAGTPVKIEWKGNWYDGSIQKGPDEKGRCFITYKGYDHSWDEWATQSRLKAVGGGLADCPRLVPVEIEWKGKWYAGTIDAGPNDQGKCHIHYDGYGKEWDEWVTQGRLRWPQ